MTNGGGRRGGVTLVVFFLAAWLPLSCQSTDEAALTAPHVGQKNDGSAENGAGGVEAGGSSNTPVVDSGRLQSSGGAGGRSGASAGGSAANAADGSPANSDTCQDSAHKRCGGFCVTPRPAVGCGPTGCDPCPEVPHAHATCVGTTCSFRCDPGTVQTGGACAPTDGGVVVVSCTNGVRDGSETDVDCGGAACPACALGKKCSTVSDCENGECDAASKICVCKRLTCADVTATCGTLSDGCGGTITCAGTCSAGICYNGRCCTPRTKAECGANACGQTDDGCGGVLDCGSCTPPEVCGLVVVNQCSAGTSCGTDTDFDGLDDCTEDNDGDPWTDKTVFNGVSARLADSCNLLNACNLHLIDTLSEVENCYSGKSALESRNQFSGWDFTTTGDQSCSASYGFQPTWTVCRSRFSVDARARINLPANDTYCFAVDGETANQCASFFFDAETAALQPGAGPRCYATTAGEHTVHWLYTVESSAGNRRFRVLFCRGAGCTPTAVLPSSMLRLP